MQRLHRVLSEHVRRSLAQAGAPGGEEAASLLLPGLDRGSLEQAPLDLPPLGPRLARLCASHPAGAAAIAVNSFLGWRACPEALELAGVRGFRELHLNIRLPTGVRGTPPLMDVLALGGEVVAVTAQAMGYLAARHGGLAAAYADLRLPEALAPWRALMLSLDREPRQFRHVDAAALVKSALGLNRTFPERPIRLLCLFLEPSEPERHAVFAAHRAELRELASRLRGGLVSLHAQSFAELWSSWHSRDEPAWLREIAARLRARYLVAAPR